MITEPKTGDLAKAVISGVAHEGLTVTTRDGQRAQLAIVDDAGTILEVGQEVAREAFNVSVSVFRNLWIGKGHLRVMSGPNDCKIFGGSKPSNAELSGRPLADGPS